jgi:RNA polymerase sigma-70 factor (ECF subfamily)
MASDGLIDGYLRGDASAVGEVDGWIRAACGPYLRRFGEDAEDALQEVRAEVLVLLRREQFRGESSLKTYLWRVACNTCFDLLRHRRRRPVMQVESMDELKPSGNASPLDRVLLRERRAQLLAVLESMTPECRTLWGMILDGLGYREIGKRLGVAEGALRVRAHRCRKRAVEALDP